MVLVGAVHTAFTSPLVVVVDKVGLSGVDGISAKVSESDLSEVAPAVPAAVIAVTVNSMVAPRVNPVKVLFVIVPPTTSSLEELISVTL